MPSSFMESTPPSLDRDVKTVAPEQGVWVGGPTTAHVGNSDYEIMRELGRGGMGVVYKARQISLDRIVALKMIRAGAHAGEAELARFRAEGEAVARLQHPNIVQIFEVGECDGLPFFSLEYCGGGSLKEKLGGTPLPPTQAGVLVETLASAVQAAHDKGIAHRDLKPANVMLADDGVPKITDFGLAKKLDEDGDTQTGAVMGTPSYMAPEQAAGESKAIGPAADVYALGVILYELLTGRPPFKAATPLETLKQVLEHDAVPPRQFQPKTPRDLEIICQKCLQKAPAKRYQSAAALADDLRRFREGKPILARPVGTLERAAKWARRRPALAAAYGLLLAALVLGVGGGGATWLWLRAENARDALSDANGKLKGLFDEAEQARHDLDDANRRLTEYSYREQVVLAQHEWEVGEVGPARLALDEADGLLEQLAPKRRPWEADYLRRILHPELAILAEGVGAFTSVAFSPDGCRLVTGGYDGTARLWDAATGKQLAVCLGHKRIVDSVAFSPDGARIVTAGLDGTARLWDAATGEQLVVLQGHASRVASAAFSPDGAQVVTGGNDGTARLWDAASGRQRVVMAGHTAPVRAATFSPDGARVATASDDQTARVWDAASGRTLAVLKGHTKGVATVAFSPDGRRVATGGVDTTARLWEAANGKPLAVLQGHTGMINRVAFSPEGSRLATASDDHTARVWSAADGKPAAILQGHLNGVFSVAFRPDGAQIATAGVDATVRLWDATFFPPAVAVLKGHTKLVHSIAFSPDGARLATASSDRTARIWDAASGRPLAVLMGHTGGVNSVAFSPDGACLATASSDRTARIWDAANGKPLAVLRGHTELVYSVAFSPDGSRLATAGGDRTARIWDAANGKPLVVLTGHTAALNSVAFSPDGSHVVTASEDETARLWDADGKQLTIFQGTKGEVYLAMFSGDGSRVVTAGADLYAREWDAATGKQVAVQKRGGMSMAYSPDGARVVAGDKDVQLWDVAAGKPLIALKGHSGAIFSLVFSPDGSRIASGATDGTVSLWIARESKEDQEKRRRYWEEENPRLSPRLPEARP